MQAIHPNDLLNLENYEKIRDDFRSQTMKVKSKRFVNLGEHLRLLFENQQTITYQVQEMLRIEKISAEKDISEELKTYNPLIPNGSNLKATMMIEYTDVRERKAKLTQLIDIEKMLYLQINNGRKITPIANEDLNRSTDKKTSAVHFIRFELNADEIKKFKDGCSVIFAVNHPQYQAQTEISASVAQELSTDFD